VPFPPVKERFDRLEEQLAIVTGLWTTPPGETFSFEGKHYRLTDSPALPKPAQSPRPPIIVGGSGPKRTPELAARFADEFNVPFLSLDSTRDVFARVSAACERQRRAMPVLSVAQTVAIGRTDEEAKRLATSQQRSFIDGAFRRRRTLLKPPIDDIEDYWHPHEKAQLQSMLSCSFVGSPETVRTQIEAFTAEHQPDELIVATTTFDQQARLHSLEQLAGLRAGAAV